MSLVLRAGSTRDVAYVVAREADASARRWIERWSFQQHREAMAGGVFRYLIAEVGKRRVGFFIVAGPNAEGELELRRLVVHPVGAGLGTLALLAFLTWAFRDDRVLRVWLDVFEDNGRARALYSRLGFVPLSLTSSASGRRLEFWSIGRDRWTPRYDLPASAPGSTKLDTRYRTPRSAGRAIDAATGAEVFGTDCLSPTGAGRGPRESDDRAGK